MMHTLLLGATGYVGTEFVRQIRQRGDRLSTLSHRKVNLYDPITLRQAVANIRPDCLINCAGYTGKPNVDACETDKANCLAGNAVLPGVIGQVCQDLGVPWGHVSSGCIYTGKHSDGSGFKESDPPNFTFRQDNCSFYSGTKALGEEVLSDHENCYVWRLRIPFSNIDSPRNYLSKLQRYDHLLEAENSLSHLAEFVAACLDCFAKTIPFGIYNLTNPGSVQTSQVVQWIQDAGICKKEFRFFESEDEFMQLAAKTPRSNCVLDSSKAVAAGLRLTPIRDSIFQALETWVAESQTPVG